MAGSTRYLRYIVLAVVTLVVIFFISSSSSTTVDEKVKSATELLKSQGSLWKGSSFGEPKTPIKPGPQEHHKSGDSVQEDVPGNAAPSADQSSEAADVEQTRPLNPYTIDYSSAKTGFPQPAHGGERVNATFVSLARNRDAWEIARSIRQVEDRFNHNYHYDWVFLNDEEFDDEFKKVTSTFTSGRARYGLIGSEHWGFPDFIDQEKARQVREQMHVDKIIYGDSISYRHMCRYESGFFFQHPLMLEYDFYWRVEPSIELFCDVDFDPFKFMRDNDKKYSFTLSLYEYEATIRTLWDSVKRFMAKHPEHIAEDNSMDFISEDGGQTYNNCHFWSNFEIGSLKWLRSKAYTDYFNQLDKDGGFFYERWGDAPVHSIAAAILLPKDQIHFFNNIAYYHVPFTHCPTGDQIKLDLKCHCDRQSNFDWNGYSCKSEPPQPSSITKA